MSASPSTSIYVVSDNPVQDFRDSHSHRQSANSIQQDSSLIPPEALKYNPKPSEIIKPLHAGPPVRLIFGDLELVPHEVEGLTQLRRVMMDEPELVNSTVFRDDHYAVRFLQGNDWDLSRCIVDMKRHMQWRIENLPVHRHSVEELLPRGFVYIHGRDHAFRPIFIIRCKSFVDSKVDEVMPVVIYWLEFALARMLVKNKVEQWRVMIDLEDCSIANVPIGILKNVCDTLTRNYRGRLFGMLILNAGFLFRSLWQVISVVLPERTKSKIKLSSSASDGDFLSSVSPTQVEERYGGLCTNLNDFRWPAAPPGPYTDL